MSADFSVPQIPVSKDLFERVQFSVSSRNAEAKVSECGTHMFASVYVDNPSNIEWQYISSGVTCILRNKELAKNGKKQVWAMNLCLYNANYGVLVWKGKLSHYADYTAVADNVHVFGLSEVNGIVGLVFTDSNQAKELHRTYLGWHEERMREERSKGSSSPASQPRFKKEMISKPCNFQHIQGTQALDECIAIDKIKSDIAMALLGLGRARMESIDGLAEARRGSSSGKRKRDISKPRLEFGKLALPRASSVETERAVNPPEITYDQSPNEEVSSPISEGLPYTTTVDAVPMPGAVNYSLNPNIPDPALGQVANGYPVEDYPPPAMPTNGYTGYSTAGLQLPATHYDLDAEVQQYTTLQGTPYAGASQSSADWRPPGRLSPLNMEEEFLQSELFTSSVMPTH